MAETCTTLNDHIRGSEDTYRTLIDETLRCAGSGVEIRKADWIARSNVELSMMQQYYNTTVPATMRVSLLEKRGNVLKMIHCDGEDGGGEETTESCVACGQLVCNTCRFHDSYGEVFEQLGWVARDCGKAAGCGLPGLCLLYDSVTADELDQRWDVYCDPCLPDVIRKTVPKIEDGATMKCACKTGSMGWMCIPCFQGRVVQRSHATYLCANRRKVEGCLGSGRGKVRICRWCRCETKRGRYAHA